MDRTLLEIADKFHGMDSTQLTKLEESVAKSLSQAGALAKMPVNEYGEENLVAVYVRGSEGWELR